MEINFEDYLSEDERKRIVADTFRQHCIEKFKIDHERIFSNAAYAVVGKMVDEAFDGEAMRLVAEKAKEVIGELSPHTVFKRKDAWEREDSVGYVVLQEELKNSRAAIRTRLDAIIEGMNQDQMRETLREEAIYLLDAKLFGKAA